MIRSQGLTLSAIISHRNTGRGESHHEEVQGQVGDAGRKVLQGVEQPRGTRQGPRASRQQCECDAGEGQSCNHQACALMNPAFKEVVVQWSIL